ncbi:MAG TPA: hypothetical protein VG324_17010 [Blastocatellia bacterium]|nr:hypothetical protein [Blastocatellia bacterium]
MDSLTDSSIQIRKLTWIAEALGAKVDRAEDNHKMRKEEHKMRKADKKGETEAPKNISAFALFFVSVVVKVELILFG